MRRSSIPVVLTALLAALVAAPMAVAQTINPDSDVITSDTPDIELQIQDDVNRGQTLLGEDKPAEAEPYLRRAAELAHQTWGADSPDGGIITVVWADALSDLGKHHGAEAAYKLGIERIDAAVGREHPWMGRALNNLGLTYHVLGRYREALDMYDQTLAIYAVVEQPNSGAIQTTMTNKAVAFRALGRYAEADGIYREVLAIREATLEPGDARIGSSLHNMAVNLFSMDRHQEAEDAWRRAFEIREAALGADHPLTVQTLWQRANALVALGRPGPAEAMMRRAVEGLDTGQDDPDLSSALAALGGLLTQRGELLEAEAILNRAVEVAARLDPDHPDVSAALQDLAEVKLAQGDPAAAEPLIRQALAIDERALGDGHPDLIRSLNMLAVTVGEQDRRDEAVELFRRAETIADAALPEGHLVRIGARADLGAALAANRQPVEAMPLLREAGERLIAQEGAKSVASAAARQRLGRYRQVYRLTVTAAWNLAEAR